jgi:hypothetical protein
MNSTCFESDRCQTDNLSSRIMPLIFSFDLKENFSGIVFRWPHCSVQKNSVCPNASSCRSFIQIPPIRGLVKAAAAIGPGAGKWSKTKHVKNQRSAKIRRLRLRSKNLFSAFSYRGIYIVYPLKK